MVYSVCLVTCTPSDAHRPRRPLPHPYTRTDVRDYASMCTHCVISGWRKGVGLGRGFTEVARFCIHAINYSPLISAVLLFPPQLPLDRRYSAWKRSLATPILLRAHAYLAIAFACCHGYQYTNSAMFVFCACACISYCKCSACTVSKSVHIASRPPSFETSDS